jgi:hypothetical protein
MFFLLKQLFVQTFSGFCWFDISLLCIYDHINQNIHSHALQSIIFSEMNCDYTFTYEKSCLKKLRCSKSKKYLSFCLF